MTLQASSGIIPAAKGKADPPQKTKSGEGRDTKGLSLDLPPMDNINRVFEDITSKAFTKLDFDAAIKFFDNRPVRVATMCSGTESPLLALGMISDGGIHTTLKAISHFANSKQRYIPSSPRTCTSTIALAEKLSRLSKPSLSVTSARKFFFGI